MASVGYAGLLSGLACSEGASPICGGGTGGSFSDVGAAYSLQPPSSVVRPPSLPFSICILNIYRCTVPLELVRRLN